MLRYKTCPYCHVPTEFKDRIVYEITFCIHCDFGRLLIKIPIIPLLVQLTIEYHRDPKKDA